MYINLQMQVFVLIQNPRLSGASSVFPLCLPTHLRAQSQGIYVHVIHIA